MNVEQLMTKNVRTCRPTATLNEVVELMESEDCGCLPVVAEKDQDEVVGMITDRDICLAAFHEDKKLSEIKVSQVMSPSTHKCRPSDDHATAARVMANGRVRRIPVIEGGRLRGMLTLSQIARASADGASREITAAEVGKTLASICEPSDSPRREPN